MKETPIYKILSSEAKLRVLKTLSDCNIGLSLRQVENLSGLAIGSVQAAIPALVREKILKKEKRKGKTLYKLNLAHPFADCLRKIFDAIEYDDIKQRSLSYQKKAQASLQFCTEQFDLIAKGRAV